MAQEQAEIQVASILSEIARLRVAGLHDKDIAKRIGITVASMRGVTSRHAEAVAGEVEFWRGRYSPASSLPKRSRLRVLPPNPEPARDLCPDQGQCRWPVSRDGEPFALCSDSRLPGKSYCQKHQKKAYPRG